MANVKDTEDEDAGEGRRYRAPALEKGLDVLELLAREARPLTMSAIVQQLDRSVGELFRMVQVLEYRGFIEETKSGDGYRLTSRLFQLGLDQPRVKTVLEAGLPVMRDLATATGQSCHLAIHSDGEIVVVGRMESSEQIGFSVRPGYRRALHRTVSGRILYAFQLEETRALWETLLKPKATAKELADLRRQADHIRASGHAKAASAFVEGITDISAPILVAGIAIAALTVPFVHSTSARMDEDGALSRIILAAAEISAEVPDNE